MGGRGVRWKVDDVGESAPQAARTSVRKRLTSAVSCSACRERLPAAPSTWLAAAPVLLAAWLTPAMLAVTSCVLDDVCCTLREISDGRGALLLDRRRRWLWRSR